VSVRHDVVLMFRVSAAMAAAIARAAELRDMKVSAWLSAATVLSVEGVEYEPAPPPPDEAAHG
jgi:hypothetical protein